MATSGNLSLLINNGTNECRPSPPVSPESVAFFGIALPLFCLAGAFCNILNFAVFADRRHLPLPAYIYLAVIAVVHFAALITEASISLNVYFFNGNRLAEIAFAFLLWPLFNYTSTLSLSLIAGLAGEIYFATRSFFNVVACPTSPNSNGNINRRQRRARIVVAAICCAVFIANLPRMIAFKIDWQTGCYEHRWPSKLGSWFSQYTYARLVFLNFGGVFLLLVFFSLLIALLCRRRENVPVSTVETVNGSRRIVNYIVNLARPDMPYVLMATFFICFVIEALALFFSPITFTTFWNHFELSKATLKNIANLSRSGSVLLAVEYNVIFLLSIIFSQTYRKLLLKRFSRQKTPSIIHLQQGSESDATIVNNNIRDEEIV